MIVTAREHEVPVVNDMAIDYGVECVTGMTGALHTYWRSKRGAGETPAWSDIDLMDIYELAPWIIVKEAVDRGREWRNRYFGTGIVRKLGIEGTGLKLADYHSPAEVRLIRQMFGIVCHRRIGVRLSDRCVVGDDGRQSFEGLYLPLEGPTGEIDFLIGLEDYSSFENHHEGHSWQYDFASVVSGKQTDRSAEPKRQTAPRTAIN